MQANELDLLICVPLIGAVMGAFFGVPLQRWLGRKKAMLVAYVFCSVPGSFLQLFAPNMAAMIVGRLWNSEWSAQLLLECQRITQLMQSK